MPLLPFKTRVRRAAQAQLETIKGGTLYWSTPSLVTPSMLEADQYATELATGPVFGVMRAPGSSIVPSTMETGDEPQGENDGLPPGFMAEIRFATWAYVMPTGDPSADGYKSASDLLDEVQQDIETCLRVDPTLGGLVADVRPDGEDWNDGGESEPYGSYMQIWLARKWPNS